MTLDHRRLKTPNGSILLLNSEPLARAIAAEWDAQSEIIRLPTMHLVIIKININNLIFWFNII